MSNPAGRAATNAGFRGVRAFAWSACSILGPPDVADGAPRLSSNPDRPAPATTALVVLVTGPRPWGRSRLDRRALETDFRFDIAFGLSFTFGSIYSTVVNARLDGAQRGFHRIPLADD
jgi:hypothetical protein